MYVHSKQHVVNNLMGNYSELTHVEPFSLTPNIIVNRLIY